MDDDNVKTYLCQVVPFVVDGESSIGPAVAYDSANAGHDMSVSYYPHPSADYGIAVIEWLSPYTPTGEYLVVHDGGAYIGDTAVDDYGGFTFDSAWVKTKLTEIGLRP